MPKTDDSIEIQVEKKSSSESKARELSVLYQEGRVEEALSYEIKLYNNEIKKIDNERWHQHIFSIFSTSAFDAGKKFYKKYKSDKPRSKLGLDGVVVTHNLNNLAHNELLMQQYANLNKVRKATVAIYSLTNSANTIFNNSDFENPFHYIIQSKGSISSALLNLVDLTLSPTLKYVLWNSAPPCAAFFLGAISESAALPIYYSMKFKSLNLGIEVKHICFPVSNSLSSVTDDSFNYEVLPYPLAEACERYSSLKFNLTSFSGPRSILVSLNRKEKLSSSIFKTTILNLLKNDRTLKFFYTWNGEDDEISSLLETNNITEYKNLRWIDFKTLSYSKIGVALDPFPLAGGLTTINLMGNGVPVVAMRDCGLDLFFPDDITRVKTSEDLHTIKGPSIICANSQVDYMNIVNCLVYNIEAYRKIQLSQYKALDAYAKLSLKNASWLSEILPK